MAIDKEQAYAVSYHVPETEAEREELQLCWEIAFCVDLGFTEFLVGMQHEPDMWIALAVIRVLEDLRKEGEKVRLVIAWPWRDVDAKWNAKRKEMYKTIRVIADEIYYISKESGRASHWMVDNSSRLLSDAKRYVTSDLARETYEYALSRLKRDVDYCIGVPD